MHLGELELGLGAGSLGKGGVADDVAEGLSFHMNAVSLLFRFKVIRKQKGFNPIPMTA